MLIDEIELRLEAGKGGNGVVRWRHEKGIDMGGPAGGDGGDGGDVFVVGRSDANLLLRYRQEKVFRAQPGGEGESGKRHGANGDDLILELPLGSVVTNRSTGRSIELLDKDVPIKVLSGGQGGLGNDRFKSSINRSPQQSTPGGAGEEADFLIELRLIADAGLVGLPNAGKSTLLNALTGAVAKVGNYAFTTLDPNLGVLYGKVLADLPGLIEGAAEGKGLGQKFLRHASRTRLLVHCVSLESADPIADYRVVRQEIESWENGALAKKPEMVVLTKTDATDEAGIAAAVAAFEAAGVANVAVSTALDDDSVRALGSRIVAVLDAPEA
jgi:GTP-binding protein